MLLVTRRSRAFVAIFTLLSLGGYLWYRSLDTNHQRFVKNLVRQIPDLPGRYAI
ncbi:MAG: hypothetical protein GYA17_17340 [Chloroflexi bacterium]|jgi:hypothetical protein|nr:hypothetical protein [Anaerolineaceae bacterium]NMB90125.1 hypothetical protein [Chloroflexota bacterium]